MKRGILSVLVIDWLMSSGLCDSAPMALGSMIQNISGRSSPWLRPVLEWDRAITVHLDLHLNAVLDMNEKEEKVNLHVLFSQRWRDEFLSWDPSLYGGLSQITLPASLVWNPNIVVREAVNEERQQTDPYVSLSSSGWVRQVDLVLLQLRCDLAMFLFPFDKQTCNMTLGSNLHTAKEMVLDLERSTGSLLNASRQLTLHGEWALLSVQTHIFTQTQGSQSYSRLTFQLELRRYSLFYVVNLMVPSVLVMVIDLAGFAIPVESAERIPFKVTLLFGYTVFLALVTDLLPPFRDTTPILGLYLVVCLAFLSLSVGESAVLLALGQPDIVEQPSPLQRLASTLCPGVPKKDTRLLEQRTKRMVRGLQLSYGLGPSETELGCRRDCVLRALGEELRDVSTELRTLTLRGEIRREALQLMEALDRLCFRVYVTLLSGFLSSLVLIWAFYR